MCGSYIFSKRFFCRRTYVACLDCSYIFFSCGDNVLDSEYLQALVAEEEVQSFENSAESFSKRKVARQLFPSDNKKVLIAKGKNCVDSLALTLTLPPPCIAKLSISEISLTKNRFLFEGKVLNKYGTYEINEKNFKEKINKRYLKADLADRSGLGTVTLVIETEYISKNVNKIVVDTCICVEGAVVIPKNPSDGGSIDFSLAFDALTFILKAEPFDIKLVFVPKLSISSFLEKLKKNPSLKTTIAFVIIQVDSVEKSEGGVFVQLTIADGDKPMDRATLTFVNKRKAVYYQLVHEFRKGNFVPYIARNIGAWANKSRTLSILDITVLAPVHVERKRKQLERIFHKQVGELGYGKELLGKLCVVNVNGAIVVKACRTCKGGNVCSSGSGFYCYNCGEVPAVDEVARLVCKILHNNNSTEVFLVGDIVDTILQLPKPFLSLFKEDGVEARIMLSKVLVEGAFLLDPQGVLIGFRAPALKVVDP